MTHDTALLPTVRPVGRELDGAVQTEGKETSMSLLQRYNALSPAEKRARLIAQRRRYAALSIEYRHDGQSHEDFERAKAYESPALPAKGHVETPARVRTFTPAANPVRDLSEKLMWTWRYDHTEEDGTRCYRRVRHVYSTAMSIDPRTKGDSEDDAPVIDCDEPKLATAAYRYTRLNEMLDSGAIEDEAWASRCREVEDETGFMLRNEWGFGWYLVEIDTGYEVEMPTMTSQAQLRQDRLDANWLRRDAVDIQREKARNAEMRRKDDAEDMPTRQGGQYIGTLETEKAFLDYALNPIREEYRSILNDALAKGVTKDVAKNSAQLRLLAQHAQALTARFNLRRCVNALEQMKDEPDFPEAWKLVEARRREAKLNFEDALAKYRTLISLRNKEALLTDDSNYVGVMGLVNMDAPLAADMTPIVKSIGNAAEISRLRRGLSRRIRKIAA